MDVDIRNTGMSALTGLWIIVIGGVLFAFAFADHVWLVLLPCVGLALVGAGVCRARCWTDTDRLHVRNWWTTRIIRKDELQRFAVNDTMDFTARSMRARTVYAVLNDGTSVRLWATQHDYYKFWNYSARAGATNAADTDRMRLNEWLAGR
jgi:hypothetical protein